MMRLFYKLTGDRPPGARAFVSRVNGRSSVSFSEELRDAIDAAHVVARDPDDDGPRIVVISPSLRGSFVFSRDEAERRIRLTFPELNESGVLRGVRHLESRARLAALGRPAKPVRRNWVNGWKED